LKTPVSEENIGRLFTRYDDYVLLAPPTPCERGPELGAAPLWTSQGWLLLISPANQSEVREWHIGCLLLDLDNPRKILGYLPNILMPRVESELTGVVNNVAFPSGAVIRNDELMVYYGAGDSVVNLASCSVTELLTELAASSPPVREWPY
jgi:predicted GH43/DUF377 family glycosyl hydrolase